MTGAARTGEPEMSGGEVAWAQLGGESLSLCSSAEIEQNECPFFTEMATTPRPPGPQLCYSGKLSEMLPTVLSDQKYM